MDQPVFPKCSCMNHNCQDKAEYLSGGLCYWCKLYSTYQIGCWAESERNQNGAAYREYWE